MIGLHTQNQMLEVYSLICGEKYDFKEPVERNLASHRRMQASCYLSSLLFLFPDFSFSFDRYGPYSAGVELALRLMKKSEKAVKLTDSQCIPTLTAIDLHEKILNPLFKNVDTEKEDLTRYLELASSLCYTAKTIIPGADDNEIVQRVLDGNNFPFPPFLAKELLFRFKLSKLID